MIQDDWLPRSKWRHGKVERLIPSSDGVVRGAKLKVVTKGGKPTTLRRPVQRLLPLEVTAMKTPERDYLTEQLEKPTIPLGPPRRRTATNPEVFRGLIDQP